MEALPRAVEDIFIMLDGDRNGAGHAFQHPKGQGMGAGRLFDVDMGKERFIVYG
jgi:hypothetical protein